MGKINFKARTIFCRDNLDVLRGISAGCIDLIYLDPPFNKRKVFTAPIGSSAEGAAFSDIFREEDVKDEWVKSIESNNTKRAGLSELHAYLAGVKTFGNRYNYCYLVYMAIRLIECRRVLKDTGSIYLHCDSTMSHYLKIVMDCIFGEKNFRNEIIWRRIMSSKSSTRRCGIVTDHIMLYAKSEACVWNDLRVPVDSNAPPPKGYKPDETGRYYIAKAAFAHPGHGGKKPMYTYKGFTPETRWLYTRENLEKLDRAGLLVWSKTGRPYRKQYWDNHPGSQLSNLWTDIKSAESMSKTERTGYPTQKPLALLERIISASSKKGDMVLDPFCGCATTCVAAEKLGRQWAGVDISVKAYELVKLRIKNEVTLPLVDEEPHFTTEPPKIGEDDAREQGYVYVIGNSNWPNIYKVGIAKDVERRLNSFQTSDPYRAYYVKHRRETPYYLEIERHIHEKFNAANEWVEAKDAQALIAAIEAADAKLKRGLPPA